VRTLGSVLADTWIAVATGLTIVALTIPLFLNPLWVSFEQSRAEATAWTGFSESDLRQTTDAILSDLVFGPPDFDAIVQGQPVLDEREQAHMRDVRGVFAGFFGLAILAAGGGLVIAVRRRGSERIATWKAVRVGALGLIVVLVVAGAIALVAFDWLFETFHSLFFPSGSYDFDPTTERLVQLFPFQFWQETAIAVGAVCIAIALAVAAIAMRRLASRSSVSAAASLEGSRP
jgi:integral membrane protein (TIGR01906 family)